MQALNGDFRVCVTRLNGHFTSHDRMHVDATLERASRADVVVIDLRRATFDDISAFRFLRGRNHHAKLLPHVRVIVSDREEAFDAFNMCAPNGRIHILRDVNIQRPAEIAGLAWEEFLLTGCFDS